MSTQTFTIQTIRLIRCGEGFPDPQPVDVRAAVLGEWAIHRALNTVDLPYAWSVTYLPAGTICCIAKRLAPVVQAVHALQAVRIHLVPEEIVCGVQLYKMAKRCRLPVLRALAEIDDLWIPFPSRSLPSLMAYRMAA